MCRMGPYSDRGYPDRYRRTLNPPGKDPKHDCGLKRLAEGPGSMSLDRSRNN